ncbi:hypothetical protein KC322_g18342, partial [Hortaea werneckii]
MLPRRAVTCLNTPRLSSKCGKAIRHGRPQRRLSSTSASSAAGAPFTVASPAAPLASITGELDKLTPRFDVSAEDIEILRSPSDFFETLKEKISKAQDRIYLSTLYVGKTEHELIATIRDALKANPNLKVSLLTDALRGTREEPDPSCASLLASIIKDFGPERVEVRMYHTP